MQKCCNQKSEMYIVHNGTTVFRNIFTALHQDGENLTSMGTGDFHGTLVPWELEPRLFSGKYLKGHEIYLHTSHYYHSALLVCH